jgi:flavin reductase (DIM6/NTAB) family NADH-FMN oxidoreductase RutF
MLLGTPEHTLARPEASVADADVFRAAMRRFATTVSIISCNCDGSRYGMAATAVTSLSTTPPALLVCVNKSAATHRALCRGGHFCVNVLRSRQIGISRAFSGQMRGEDRFEIGDWQSNDEGLPFIADAQANLFCEIERTMEYATHTIFIARVYSARVKQEVDPLIYQDGAYAIATPVADQVPACETATRASRAG